MAGRLCALGREYFDPGVRARGREYHASGRVRVTDSDRNWLLASVRGSRAYEVELTLRPDGETAELVATCTCPYFEGSDNCKHIWAVLQAADEKNLLPLPPDILELRVNEEYEPPVAGRSLAHSLQPTPPKTRKQASAAWQRLFSETARVAEAQGHEVRNPARSGGARKEAETRFELVVDDTYSSGWLRVRARVRIRRQSGEWGRWKDLTPYQKTAAISEEDHLLVLALAAAVSYGYSGYYGPTGGASGDSPLNMLLPRLCATGRLYATRDEREYGPLKWDEGPPWEVAMEVAADPTRPVYRPVGWLVRGDEKRPLKEPLILLAAGWVIWKDRISRLDTTTSFAWIRMLRGTEPTEVPVEDGPELAATLAQLPGLPRLVLPEPLRFEEATGKPQPQLAILAPDRYNPNTCPAQLAFRYETHNVDPSDARAALLDADRKRLLARDRAAEKRALDLFVSAGGRWPDHFYQQPGNSSVSASRLPRLVRSLCAAGWEVTASGKRYRMPGAFEMAIESGVDWFDLHASCSFEDQSAALPALLAALRKRESWVRLDDGSLGLLPEEWLDQHGLVAALGEVRDDVVRFRKTQAGLLDAWLESQPDVRLDEIFQRVRGELRQFERVEPAEAPPGFRGELRPYQKDGLGWLQFLQRFGFGGCLADDMGLGKTVQVLALLESRRRRKKAGERAPSLVVAPLSVVFNWLREAARFTPRLRARGHTGKERAQGPEAFEACDLVLTTYGTLRRDVHWLKDCDFDYVILDESQSVKNAGAQTAKAVRLLRSEHRLALSGTPIENHLGELWSLMEFLNPGFLGHLAGFDRRWARDPDPQTRATLARAVRPFILRRTKSQVAPDLPERQEETLYCELPEHQRKLYDELKEHYRGTLLGKIEKDGLNRSKMHVLEALLRLRQAACHPALLDGRQAGAASAKFEMLLPELAEVAEEGHKALVFSQFTSLLALLRKSLDARGIAYEYLDGKTRDREARVDRFQTDPKCPIFLISLKAGGLGLNLTAAEYVFLLDPWWNPAVEAQAIDRAHRIGQKNKVFAYRLIALDTVEEKILELQRSKKDLADAIISQDNALLRNLTRQDLEFLLGA